MPTTLDTVNRYLQLTSSSSADLAQAVGLLAQDVVFSGPLMRMVGRDAYAGLLKQFLPSHVSTRILQQFADGDQVCSINELTVRTPAGGTITLAMAEWFKMRDGQIAEHTLFYDPRAFAEAFGMSA